ncbi:TRAP transporter small permease [Metabacillus rhizolycopersici]|uniref:TRAP transporter small permease n=1 Tax=Metabacillus rhizolycopersici TaxID=2875709 RepID=A0ABS7UNJ5_9BACI|nr:TRAP transporter small permease [Metabacillus rhizolycopersici]MBZ5749652.1 TRAP transporter small permease [Metabacillus rhizolycopersici]
MQTVRKWMDQTIAFSTCTLMGIMVLVSIWQVFTRYVLNAPSTFSEEFLRYSLIWVSMLGSAYVFGQKKHFAIEFILEKLSKKKALILNILIEVVILGFAIIVMVIGGSKTVLTTMAQSSAGLGIPMGYVYLSLPVSGILIIGYSLLSLIEVKNKPEVDLVNDDLEMSYQKLKSKILE